MVGDSAGIGITTCSGSPLARRVAVVDDIHRAARTRETADAPGARARVERIVVIIGVIDEVDVLIVASTRAPRVLGVRRALVSKKAVVRVRASGVVDFTRVMGGAVSAARSLFDKYFGNVDMRVVMLGLDAAGKTTILYKLHIGEVLSTVPTLGFNVEKVQYKNVVFTVWDVGGQEKLRPLWRHYFNNTDGLIFVVDCLDRDRVQRAKEEFYSIINDAFMKNSAILIFANKQDLRGAMTTSEIVAAFDLPNLRGRRWHVQASCATQGLGLYEGLDWLSSTLTKMRRLGVLTSVGQSGEKHGQGRQGRAAAFT